MIRAAPARQEAANKGHAMLRAIRSLFRGSDAAPDNNGPVTLNDVLANDWLELWYQPKIELRRKRLSGAEALARARHPERGILNPGTFLANAPESDLLALTERVIRTALRDWDDFDYYDMPIKIAVNTPVSAFTKLPIANIILSSRPRSSRWPGLILEVTEDEIIHEVDLANQVAEAVSKAGCKLALDDFGAGYSSLGRLTQLPFSELKIDRSYVTDCHVDRVNAGLCEVIVELGQRFGLKTVAEGIETVHEYHKLQGLGCDIGQGYLFSKPLAKNDFIGTAHRRLVSGGEEQRAAG
jgi:EAL domain-containing protein (putative c-di-GMP-specific phosphodiesterase class I)